ncbi:peptide chain release factor N(5)-glutamine methyltransferase [Thiomicrorhabdus sp.]|uniref:peptide chain release factor N(5)-glutamine methyltransferase n=1 Tax=Thiomicrorhabdus sp. TaxID=2039724 RepID=UPI002AA7C9FE|nr:peptide chain release factor N(5)-glutamine methyltransferase [Thiomicrorhabdus sp.]
MLSIQNTLQQAQEQLKMAGLVDSPGLDAELLLCDALGVNRTYLFTWPEKILTNQQTKDFANGLQQRLLGKPIAHIIGHREFWGLNLQVTPDTLIPRPDTETLIEAVLEIHSTHNSKPCGKILDLGTGSGAIALALKSELPGYDVTAVDQSTAALDVAQQNAQQLNLQVNFLTSDWFSAIEGTFDFIVSNPPYIEDNDPHLQQGDVRFEPLSALTSGKDGLTDIKFIIYQAWSYLETQGWLLIEHGYNQAQPIQTLLKEAGYQNITTKQDLGGNPRISLAQKP